MDDFKDSTKTQYLKGGPVGIKGAAKASQVMHAYRKGGRVTENVSSRPVDKRGRSISDEELSTPESVLQRSGRADPYEVAPRTAPKPKPKPRIAPAPNTGREIPDDPLQRKLNTLPSERGEMPKRGPSGAGFNRTPYCKGGLAALSKRGK